MKIYRGTTKRIAKKKIGHSWYKILAGSMLKSGDIVSTCVGYNQIIKEISPVWTGHGLSKGRYIIDFYIITNEGSSHSLTNCCSFPRETRDEILAYWRSSEMIEWANYCGSETYKHIVEAVGNNVNIFDDDGLLNRSKHRRFAIARELSHGRDLAVGQRLF